MTLEQLNICATFFGALVALIIFNQWRNQKGSEVLSAKCEELLLDINIFYEILINNYVLFISCITSNNDDQEFWNTRADFHKKYVKIKNNINIVCLYKDDKNLKYINEKITNIFEKYENLVLASEKKKDNYHLLTSENIIKILTVYTIITHQ